MKSKNVIILAPLPAIKRRTRLSKMVAVFRSCNIPVEFLGWEREDGEATHYKLEDSHVSEKIILRGGGYASSKARLMYPLWAALVFWNVLFRHRDEVVFCLGWETAFPARLAAIFSGVVIVFDDADRFSMIFRLPRFLHRILVRLERWTSGAVDLHLIPSFSRYEWRNDRMRVLRNSPLTSDFEAAKRNPKPRECFDLIVYVNGWIGETRGAGTFLRALDLALERDLNISMILAGRLTGPEAELLSRHKNVTFIGEVSQDEALSWYPGIDVLLTYYDPSVPINRKAESNKWGDAIFFGKPFVVNLEVETAEEFLNQGAAWGAQYSDHVALVNIFDELISVKDALDIAGQAAHGFKLEYLPFDASVLKILSELSFV